MDTMACGSCGAVVDASARFCSSCGAPVGAPVVAVGGVASDVPPPGMPPPVAGTYAPPAPYPPPYAYAPTRTNGLAIASMVLGIVWIYWIGSVLALVFGYVALGQIKRSGGTQGGRGMAIAGIVLGWIGLALLVLFIVLAIVASNETSVRYERY